MGRRATVRTVVLLLAVAAVGAAGLRWAAARGIGLNPDSAFYLDCAAGLAGGEGYDSALFNYYRPLPAEDYVREAVAPGGVRPRPVLYFLPAYPAVLAVLIGAGARPETAALWLAIVPFGLSALLVGLIVHGLTRGSTPFAVGAALVMLGSESMLVAHSQALSESLFIVLSLACLRLLTKYLEKGALVLLVGAGIAAGLAAVTRYPGVALAGVGLIGLLFFVAKPFSKRIGPALAFLALSCVPLALFVLRGFLEMGRAPFNLSVLRPADARAVIEALSGLASWILPGSHRVELVPGQALVLSTVAALALLGLSAAGLVAGTRRGRALGSGGPRSGNGPPLLYAAFIPAYLAAFLAAEAILKGCLLPDIRLLAPIFPPFLIVAVWWIKGRVDGIAGERARRAASAALAAYVLVYAGCGIYWMAAYHRLGRGYNNSSFQAADVASALALVRSLGAVPIFTNDCGAVYFQAGRYAYQFPSRFGAQDPAVIADALGDHPACFVYYWTPAHRKALGPGRERESFERGLTEAIGLRPLVRSETLTVLWKPPGRP